MDTNINKAQLTSKNALVNKFLCNFIADKFLRTFRDQKGFIISQNQYANLCGLSSSTISKIKTIDGYDLPISTIYNICRHEQYPLKKFFSEFEEKYGINIPE